MWPWWSARCWNACLLRVFYGRDEVLLVLVTYALFLILEDVSKLIWGVNPYYVTAALWPVRRCRASAACSMSATTSPSSPISRCSCGIGVWFGLNRTVLGKIVLAVIHNDEMSRQHGHQSVAGSIWAPSPSASSWPHWVARFTAPMISVQPGISVGVIIVSFAVVIIGGLGSIGGAAIGALIVGLARSTAVHIWPGRVVQRSTW